MKKMKLKINSKTNYLLLKSAFGSCSRVARTGRMRIGRVGRRGKRGLVGRRGDDPGKEILQDENEFGPQSKQVQESRRLLRLILREVEMADDDGGGMSD